MELKIWDGQYVLGASGALLGKAVYRARLAAVVMGVPGVENCVLSAPAADLAAAEGVLPVLGTLTVTAAGGDGA